MSTKNSSDTSWNLTVQQRRIKTGSTRIIRTNVIFQKLDYRGIVPKFLLNVVSPPSSLNSILI